MLNKQASDRFTSGDGNFTELLDNEKTLLVCNPFWIITVYHIITASLTDCFVANLHAWKVNGQAYLYKSSQCCCGRIQYFNQVRNWFLIIQIPLSKPSVSHICNREHHKKRESGWRAVGRLILQSCSSSDEHTAAPLLARFTDEDDHFC